MVALAGTLIVVLAVALTIAGFGGGNPSPETSHAPTLPPVDTEGPVGPLPSGVVPVTGEGRSIPDKVVPDRVELYPSAPSILPGQPLELHVSTLGLEYALGVDRLDALAPEGQVVVARVDHRQGHDFRRLATLDPVTRTARANWPVTDRLASDGWQPGVYVATATDQAGTVGHAIFVVRTPTLVPNQPLFVFPILTYQAYNLWGGANLYNYAAPPAVEVSFGRPYLEEDGLQFWRRGDDRILAWLQVHRLPLQYTTDYDVSLSAPTIEPTLVIFGRHTEYVGEGLRDWVEQGVNVTGRMNVLNFGSNSFYWRVRLVPTPTPGAAFDVVCYKTLAGDQVAAVDPANATVRWRDPPLERPEGDLLGAQYGTVIADGYMRFPMSITSAMPAGLLAGTGWHPGMVITGLLKGEADLAYPGSGGVAIMTGLVTYKGPELRPTSVTVRTSPAGARVFDAGTFAWSDGFTPALVPIGVSSLSFDRFTENVLAWLSG